MSIITVGIDLAKNVFVVHGVDDNGKSVLVKPKVARDKLLEREAKLPPCLIGMEACSGAHHWARLFRKYGHTVKLMAPKFVVPYRLSGKRGKTNAADAAAICEAVTRPHMRFVPVKDEHQHQHQHQQIILCLHRTRPTPTCSTPALPSTTGPSPKRRGRMPAASALLASLGGGHDFANGRQVVVWIGLTPGQYSSGGVARLGRITKAGDRYLRSLLVMGARAILSGWGTSTPSLRHAWARLPAESGRHRSSGLGDDAARAQCVDLLSVHPQFGQHGIGIGSHGRGGLGRRFGTGYAYRIADEARRCTVGQRHRTQQAAFCDIGVVERLRDVEHGRHRYLAAHLR